MGSTRETRDARSRSERASSRASPRSRPDDETRGRTDDPARDDEPGRRMCDGSSPGTRDARPDRRARPPSEASREAGAEGDVERERNASAARRERERERAASAAPRARARRHPRARGGEGADPRGGPRPRAGAPGTARARGRAADARRDRRPRLVTRRGTRAEDRARTPRDAPELAPERARRCERASPRAPKCGKVVAAVERAKRRQQSLVSRTRSHRRVRVLRDRDGPRAAAPAIGGWSFSPDRGRRVSARPRALFPRARFVPPRDARWPTRSTRRARRWTI